MMEQVIEALASKLAELIQTTGVIPGPTCYLCLGDGTGTLRVPNYIDQRLVYLYDPVQQQQHRAYMAPNQLVLYQDGHPEYESIEVRTGYRYGSNRLEVIDSMTEAGRQAIATLSPWEAFSYEAFWTSINQLTALRAIPTSPTSKSVQVGGNLRYKDLSGNSWYFVEDTYDFTSAIAALILSQDQLALLYLDRATQTLGASLQTAVTAPSSVPARDSFTETDFVNFIELTSWIPIALIYLYYGQSSIEEADFYRDYDPRPLFSGSGDSQMFQPDRIYGHVVIPANYQGNYAEDVEIMPGGDLEVIGRLYIR